MLTKRYVSNNTHIYYNCKGYVYNQINNPLKNTPLTYNKKVIIPNFTENSNLNINRVSLKKTGAVFLITFFISLFLQGLVDSSVFIPSRWHYNTWVNLAHFWFTFLSSYYLFSYLVSCGYKIIKPRLAKATIVLLVTIQIVVFLWVVITDIIFYYWYYNISSLEETTFYEFDMPLAIAVLTIGNVYFYQKHYAKPIIEERPTQNTETSPQKVKAFSGNESYFIDPKDIGLFYLSDGIVWMKLLNGNVLHTDLSLTKLTDILSPSDYFRLNRQVIVSRKAVQGYEKLTYQKLRVILVNNAPLDVNLIVSKYNAPNFKNWITNSY